MSTIIYTTTLQVLRLSVTCLIMFFVREHCVKIVAVILLASACSVYGEPPIHSNYLPPRQDDQTQNKFSTSGNLNSNSEPIETSVSFTTNEPIDSFVSTNSGASGSGVNPTQNSYSDYSKGYENKILNNGGSFGAPFNQPPPRAQQVTGGSTGYFYQQPSPTFGVPGNEGAVGQNSVARGSNEPGASQGSGSTGISNSYFNIKEGATDPFSVSPTYGVPDAGPSASPNGNFRQPANDAVPTSYRPLTSGNPGFSSPSLLYGTPSNIPGNFGSRPKEQPKLSTSYQPSDAVGTSFENSRVPSLGFGNILAGGTKNQFSSFQQPNVGNNRPAQNTPQTLYGLPSSNPSDRSPISGGGNAGSPSTSYGPAGISPTYTPQVSGDSGQNLFSSFGSGTSPNQERPSPASSYGLPSTSPETGYNQVRPSPSYGAPSSNSQERPSQSSQFSFSPSLNSPESKFNQGNKNQAYSSPISSASFQNLPDSKFNQNVQSQVRPPSSYGRPPSNIPNNGAYSQVAQIQGRPFSSVSQNAPSLATSPEAGYDLATQSQEYPSPSPTYGLPQSSLGNEYTQQRQNEGGQFSSNSRPSNNPPGASYGPPNAANSFPNQFDNSRTPPSSVYLPPLNSFQAPSKSFEQENTFHTSPRPFNDYPGSTFNNANIPTSSNKAPLGSLSQGNLDSFSQNGPAVNSLGQGFNSPSSPSYFSSPTSPGFGENVSPTYGTPISNAAFNSDKSSSSYRPSFGITSNPSGQFFSDGRKPSNEYGPPTNQGTLQPSAQPYDSTNQRIPLKTSQSTGLTNDFTGGENSFANPTFATNLATGGTSPEQDNFNTNAASSYLPPSYDPIGFPTGVSYPSISSPEDSLVPSTSYKLPSGEPNVPKGGTSNVLKNANRNVGSDLITGASASPFRPFRDDSPATYGGTNTPSRASYEKSNEVTNNDISFTGSESSEPASYEFNYNVKQAGTEFNHQESRNGSTTSGSYGVVLPDGRKQVVDYEANQEGFHPKIRYEENTRNSDPQNQETFSQNNAFNSSQNRGYNYSPNPAGPDFNRPQTSNPNDIGSSFHYSQELQPPYPSSPNYNQGNFADNQDSYSPQSQSSASNFNTYKNPATSPSQSEQNSGSSPTYNADRNSPSQFDTNSQGYNYNPSSSNNLATVYDSVNNEGYPRGPNEKNTAKQVPFYT